ncbi:MAG: hypothetical protein ACLQVD_16845 [Capsulimonadaceae bacterium]
MAITKSTDKKTTPKKGTGKPDAFDPAEALAQEYLVIRIHRAMVRLGEAVRINEIVQELNDSSISPPLVRHTMETHPRRFVAVDRRWDVAGRYLDKQAPLTRTIQELVTLYAAPMPVDELAGELAAIYGRVKEHFNETAPRMLRDAHYFSVRGSRAFGLTSWLLDISASREDDILFYNNLTLAGLEPFREAESLGWAEDPVQAVREFLVMGGGAPVDNRTIQYYAWKALGEDFDAVALYEGLLTEANEFIPLPDHRWILADSLEAARRYWIAAARGLRDIVEEVVVQEPVVEAPPKPLEVTAEDIEDLRSFIADRDESVTVGDLLSNVLEVRPGSRTYSEDSVTLAGLLRENPEHFVWVGTDRFRAPGTLPPYLGQIPDSLTFPVLPRFETADGEILDQILDDGAFDDALRDEMADSVAQDVNDQDDMVNTRWPEGISPDSSRIRLVLKAHHKEIGTFPLAQLPYGFLPSEPDIVEVVLVDSGGNHYPVYVDYNVQLIYGLFDFYSEISAESGAVFFLERTEDPSVYHFIQNNETDSAVFVNQHRLDELAEYRTEVERGPVSTYDIVRNILDHYRKGCSFLTLLTEVNLIRRTPRRLVASVLSGYTAFHERANRWAFDSKKEPEGFDRRKAPYILRR